MKENRKFRILFIDDEPASLTAFKSVFRDFYDIRLASSAEEGYEIMKKEPVDIVISDQRMPGITGVEFLHRIRVEFPETVRMLITGYSDIDAVIQSINGSMVSYYFSKPYDESDMKLILDNTIEKIKLMKENQSLLEKLQSLVEELTLAREKAEESSRLKSSLLLNLNHEFRTPMNSILGFTQILQELLTDETCKEYAGIIHTSGRRLLKTLNAIVDLARFEADNKAPDIESVNLTDLAHQAIHEFREQAQRKNILLEVDIQPGVFASFNNSFASLIINNLMDNAIKFTNQGSIRISIYPEKTADQTYAILVVSDTGIGIPPSYHEKIFEDFSQVSEGFGRYYEGLGIGLSLCKKILTRLHGEISIASELGKGTLFTVRIPAILPLADVPGEKKPDRAIETKESDRLAGEQKKKIPVILSVEDNEYNQELIELFLTSSFEIEKVYDGESAIRFVRENHVDAILMDINLGAGIDGVKAMKKIREINGNYTIPIIAVTGYTSDEDKQKLLSAGFDEFLPKPYTKEKLQKTINQSIFR